MTLANEFEHFVKAACSGLWVVSDAFDDAIMELDRRCREITAHGEANPDAKIGTWTLRVWDECSKLQRVDTDKVCRPVEKGPENLMVFLNELVQRMHTNSPDSFDASIYVLRGVGQRELRSPAICAALLTCMQLGRRCGICIVFLNAIPPAAVMDMPEELRRQLVVVEHPLPDREQLKSIAESTSSDPEVVPEGDEMESVIDAASGLTHAGAELAFAVSIIREGSIKPSVVWEQKASMLKQSAALTMHQGEETFENIGGMHGLKDFCKRIMSNRHTDPLRMPRGVLLMGVPGSGKSAFAKALGNETGRKTIALDVGALRGSLQGETEERTRKALQIVDAMGTSILFVDEIEKAFAGSESSGRTDGGTGQRVLAKWLSWMNDRTSDTFFIGTANDIESLPAAFVRAERFDAVFFLDLPDDAEKRVIWEMYLKLFELEADLEKCLQLSGQWTGAEIRSCCRLAAIMGCSIAEAREKVIPVARTANEQLLSLREWANKRCLCAKTGKMFYKAALDSSNSSLKEASRANANPSRRRLKKPAAGGGM